MAIFHARQDMLASACYFAAAMMQRERRATRYGARHKRDATIPKRQRHAPSRPRGASEEARSGERYAPAAPGCSTFYI